jgi:hypothetical protein
MLMVIFESNSSPSYSEAERSAMYDAQLEVDKRVFNLECTRGERMPWEEKINMEEGAKARALASVKELK